MSVERVARLDDVRRVALMPDVHLAESVCVGAVVATVQGIYPDAVGGDIGCGMAAVRLQGRGVDLDDDRARRILDGLRRVIPPGKWSARQALPERLAGMKLSSHQLERVLERDGRVELGTLGRGNHFLELQNDEEECLWLMVHSGSRALGPAVRSLHVRDARLGNSALRGLDAESAGGMAYLHDHDVALAFAEANRNALLQAATGVMSAELGVEPDWPTLIACTHNFIRREEHFGESLWVHRKGAISALEGEPGIIPGSMGTGSFLVSGRGCREALCSSSHGAGRSMSRTDARRRIARCDLEQEMSGIWFDRQLVEQLRDEAPSAYKPIAAVMRAQRELTRVEHRLRPILAYKGT
jgi:tRNA-splicing ligase RtcB